MRTSRSRAFWIFCIIRVRTFEVVKTLCGISEKWTNSCNKHFNLVRCQICKKVFKYLVVLLHPNVVFSTIWRYRKKLWFLIGFLTTIIFDLEIAFIISVKSFEIQYFMCRKLQLLQKQWPSLCLLIDNLFDFYRLDFQHRSTNQVSNICWTH